MQTCLKIRILLDFLALGLEMFVLDIIHRLLLLPFLIATVSVPLKIWDLLAILHSSILLCLGHFIFRGISRILCTSYIKK